MRWERIPILGDNPVFCFEARRLWTRRTLVLLVLLVLGLGLVSRVLDPLLGRALQVGSRDIVRSLLYLFASMLPPRVPLLGLFTIPSSSGQWGWHSDSPLAPFWTLTWIVRVSTMYVVPVLAALSLASDRAAGRLEPLVASRVPVREILTGKLMAPVLPFLLLLLAGAVVFVPLSLTDWARGPDPKVWRFVSDASWLILAAMVGLRVGASTRRPAAAVGISLLSVLLVLPLAFGYGLARPMAWLREILRSSTAPPELSWVADTGAAVLLHGLVFAVLWHSTKRSLERIAE